MILTNDHLHFTMSTGTGHSISKINAFDRALISAGISDYNLVKISSIIPPKCVQRETVDAKKGSLLPTAFTFIHSDSVGKRLAAAVAVGIPEDGESIGVIIKHCGYSTKENIEEQARLFALQAMDDRKINTRMILSAAIECTVDTEEDYCAFASVSLW